MKYTGSADGVPRTNVRLTIRLSEEELERFAAVSRDCEMELRDWLTARAKDGIYSALLDHEANEEEG